jgi:hypothetical protein
MLIYLEQLAKMSKDERKLCVINAAKKENAKMIENNNGRSSNYGAKPNKGNNSETRTHADNAERSSGHAA